MVARRHAPRVAGRLALLAALGPRAARDAWDAGARVGELAPDAVHAAHGRPDEAGQSLRPVTELTW